MCVTNVGTTQDNFILPPPPVGLPVSQDQLDRMKLVRNCTIPIILPSTQNMLVDTMFKIRIGYTNLGRRQSQKEGNVLFKDALKGFYLRSYHVIHMVKDHSESD